MIMASISIFLKTVWVYVPCWSCSCGGIHHDNDCDRLDNLTVSRAWCRWWTSEIERLLSFGPLASGAKCSVLHVRRVTHAIYATPKKIEEMTTALGLITLYSRIRLFMTVLSFSGLLLHFHIIYIWRFKTMGENCRWGAGFFGASVGGMGMGGYAGISWKGAGQCPADAALHSWRWWDPVRI